LAKGNISIIGRSMGRVSSNTLRHLAGTLIAAGALASCGDGMVTVDYSVEDKGIVMPQPKKATREKCYGIALAQHNDCAAGKGTDCAGTADKDYMPDRWKYVPVGNCAERGGSLSEPVEPYISQK
jgi:uncharacterized membrane protein